MNMLCRWFFLLKRGQQTFTALLWLRFAAAITSYFYACQIVSSSLQKEVCLPDTWLTMNMLCRHKFPGFFFSEGLIENVCPDICAPPVEQIFYPESLICCTSLWAIQLKLENNKLFYSNERNNEAQKKRYKRAIKKGRLTYFFFNSCSTSMAIISMRSKGEPKSKQASLQCTTSSATEGKSTWSWYHVTPNKGGG